MKEQAAAPPARNGQADRSIIARIGRLLPRRVEAMEAVEAVVATAATDLTNAPQAANAACIAPKNGPAPSPPKASPAQGTAFRQPLRPTRRTALRLALLAALPLAGVALPALPAQAAGSAPAPRIVLVLGDSLSAGYGIRQEAAWPSLLAARLKTKAPSYAVLNASISGETTAGGVSRLPPLLEKHKPAVVVIELGANDGLRGLPVAEMKKNLVTMTRAAKGAGAKVLLVRIELPPNYGAYARVIGDAFNEVARAEKLPLPPFLLDKVASDRRRFQADGLHPVAEAQGQLLDNVWPALAPLVGAKTH